MFVKTVSAAVPIVSMIVGRFSPAALMTLSIVAKAVSMAPGAFSLSHEKAPSAAVPMLSKIGPQVSKIP